MGESCGVSGAISIINAYICPEASSECMTTLDKIKAPVAGELEKYEEYLRGSLYSDNPLAHDMLVYVFNTRGKAIRPLMVLLTAAIHNGGEPLPEDSYLAAMLLEMIHTATLVHDDVIDEAFIRRGKPSVNALWQSQKAVLIGDFILAKSFQVGMQSGAYQIVEYITRVMPALCEGELTQSMQSDRLEMTREIYADIIYRKTATLMGTSCGVGAMSAGASPEQVAKMKEMGDAIGMAFQIKDDILDYKPASATGKPLCGDLRERKITLPLLTVLEKSSPAARKNIIALLSEVRGKPSNAEKLHAIVLEQGGLEMAAEVMNGYVAKAAEFLMQCPLSAYRDSLEKLFGYVASRDM